MKFSGKHKNEPFKSPEEEDLINKLPKSILKRIFSKLDFSSLLQCSLVSKGWNRVVLDENKSIEVNDFEKFERPHYDNLKDFSFRNSNVTDNDLLSCLKPNGKIQKLDFYGCKNLTDVGIENSLASYPALVKLDIGSSNLTDRVLKAVGKYCGNLEYINISWCEKITDEGVAALAQGCRILETFMCKGCPLVC